MPLWDFPEGTLCQREVAAYVVARELGWPNVPPTVLRDGPEGVGSTQLFVEFDPSQHYFTLEGTHADEFREVALFDVVVNNADRKGGHCLLGSGRHDLGRSTTACASATSPKLRTVIWEYVGEPIPPGLLEDVRSFRERLPGERSADGAGRPALRRRDVQPWRNASTACSLAGVFPEPGPGRPYPWPPV